MWFFCSLVGKWPEDEDNRYVRNVSTCVCIKLHGIICQKTVILIFIEIHYINELGMLLFCRNRGLIGKDIQRWKYAREIFVC